MAFCFSPELQVEAGELARSPSLQILSADRRRVVSVTADPREPIATCLERRNDSRVVHALCTCADAVRTRHRCVHVAATLLAAANHPRFGDVKSVRTVVPFGPPQLDSELADELLEDLGAPIQRDDSRHRPATSSATNGRHGSAPHARRSPSSKGTHAEDALARLDRGWRDALNRCGDSPPSVASRARPASLMFRLHPRGSERSWWTLAVELVVESSPASRAEVYEETEGFAELDDGVRAAPIALLHPGSTRFNAQRGSLDRLSAAERELVLMILGASDSARIENGLFRIDSEYALPLVRSLMRSGRCVVADPTLWQTGFGGLRPSNQVPDSMAPCAPARWDEGAPWRIRLDLAPHPDPKAAPLLAQLRTSLERGDEVRPLSDLMLGLRELVLFKDGAAAVDGTDLIHWGNHLGRPVEVPLRSIPALLERLSAFSELPALHVDPVLCRQIGVECGRGGFQGSPLQRHLHISAPGQSKKLLATASLRSGSLALEVGGRANARIDPATKRVLNRDQEVDRQAAEDLRSAGMVQRASALPGQFRLAQKELHTVVQRLSERGWTIEADGNVLRAPSAMRSSVHWGVDWFDLDGEVEFGDVTVPLASLLEAIRERRSVVTLGDGTSGLIPESWLKRFGLLARSGASNEGGTRFAPSALLLLEAALGEETVDRDALTGRIRAELRGFSGIQPADPPPTFACELRPYQREGLGWMSFLRRFGLGGCLADDMGLGKTVQVLAMLESRRAERNGEASASAVEQRATTALSGSRMERRNGEGRRSSKSRMGSAESPPVEPPAQTPAPRTSLVVAPRSLVFHWLQEAERFAPSLRVLDASRADRSLDAAALAESDVVVTTYGILRRDIQAWREHEFDYVVLDEAQAIKNATAQTAHAAKLLRSRHRLAMSGTPVENHLGELWSLVEFLNPALLGGGSTDGGKGAGGGFSRLRAADLADPDAAAMASKAVRPFILRRTKAQVAPQLPDRIEKVIVCQLEGAQRKLYDRLRQEVRASVLGKVDEIGMKRAGIFVLEALLRLRQAACHPALVDKSRRDEPSAKLDSLIPTLVELAAEGHKTLVFSQFTSLLDLVEPRLATSGLRWVRLDGSTRDRRACVEQFQSDPECPVFLISLKAGGLGLNLTAADHVVLLDPWWNPAVEAQAIDRAHRIGQHRTVIATRLIAADTVEQRILELQAKKRALAEAVMGGECGPLAGMTREDLEALLG